MSFFPPKKFDRTAFVEKWMRKVEALERAKKKVARKASGPAVQISSQEENIGIKKVISVPFVRFKDCTCGRRNSPFLCGDCDFRTASARVKKSCPVHPGVYKKGDITSCPGCGSPATES